MATIGTTPRPAYAWDAVNNEWAPIGGLPGAPGVQGTTGSIGAQGTTGGAGSAASVLYYFTATSAQTTFTGTSLNAGTLSYVVGNEQVYLNGVLLVRGSDYTATNGTSVVLSSGASTGDSLTVAAYGSFTVANTYTKAEVDALIAGAGGGLTLLSTTTLSGTETTISSIPQNKSTLMIVGTNLDNGNAGNSYIQLNGNATASAYFTLRSNGNQTSAGQATQVWVRTTEVANGFTHFVSNNFDENHKSVMWIYDYNTATPKNVTINSASGPDAGMYSNMSNIGYYNDGAAITSIKYVGTNLSGTIKVYGM